MASSQNKQTEVNSSQTQRHLERKNSFPGSSFKYNYSQAESAIAEWSASSIKGKLETMEKKLSHVPLIFGHSIVKVPRNLHQLEPNAFVPEVVSVGPYHWGKEHLQQMEKHKWRLLKRVIQRTGCSLKTCLSVMLEAEMVAREWYNFNDIKPKNSYDFAEMMLLDSCFILEAFYVYKYNPDSCGYSEHDPIFAWRDIIIRDLLMLENQLPFFVLVAFGKIWKENLPFQGPEDTVRRIALHFFRSVVPGLSATYGRPLHLLDLVRGSIPAPYPNITSREDEGSVSTVSDPPTPRDGRFLDVEMGNINNHNDNGLSARDPLNLEQRVWIVAKRHSKTNMVTDSVTKLRAAGVSFMKLDSKEKRFMEIVFKDGKLCIPPLTIHSSTKPIFLNLMAFEQCYPYHGRHITSYMTFMDSLINSPKDVEHLKAKGIIYHDLGSDQEVADLFNSIRREIFFDPSDYYLHDVTNKLNEYADKKWRRWFTTLRQEYLRNPWKILSVVAAATLLALTVAQATYAILSYHIHHS